MKNLNLFAILFGVLFLIACDEQDLQYRSDNDILGTWIEVTPKIIKIDNIYDTLFFDYGTIEFNKDGTYFLDDKALWIGFREGKWSYDENSKILNFEQNFPTEFNGIPIIGALDSEIYRNWEILEITDSKMKVKEHQYRQEKVVLNPITQKNDTIQGIDFYFIRDMKRVK